MKAVILLNYNDNVQQVESEEKLRFLRTLLEQMGVPIDFWDDEILNIEQKIKLRNILATYAIQVIDDLDGHMSVYVENEKIADWNKCIYKLKQDFNQLDRKKRLYMEMHIDCWSIFDELE
jgi:hypothetical protein